MDVVVREMCGADYPACLTLWNRCEGLVLREQEGPASILRFLKRNHGMSWVAVSQGGLIGCILCGHDGLTGYLYHLAIDPMSRRQGVGAVLVKHAIDRLANQKVARVKVFVSANNIAGQLFWAQQGFNKGDSVDIYSQEISTRVKWWNNPASWQ
ncbi:GNAT family N-acetyltransferase [Pseudogulbenkiania subflava]|uniref:GNAT family N-acetyltransferase n=1 Tax=Pseudogulbenkiania subflava TaxID=451637 RepID=UPI001356721F|nr:GNAT family N-acetyltransferase [Pseudogulbenkiania subflava]